MKKLTFCALAVALSGVLASGPVYADKPAWAGGGDRQEKGKGHSKERAKGGNHDDVRGGKSSGPSAEVRFTDQHRVVIREYYTTEFRGGHCPPGLAKKKNGCMPPGQAKKWRTGHPLPRDVVFHDLPPALVVKIGTPPPGYKYVRVAADILMIAVGTGMVVSAIEDLGRL